MYKSSGKIKKIGSKLATDILLKIYFNCSS